MRVLLLANMILGITLHINMLSPVLQHMRRNGFLGIARRQLKFGLVSNVLLGLKTQHITSACFCFPKGWTQGHCASHGCVWYSVGSFLKTVRFLK